MARLNLLPAMRDLDQQIRDLKTKYERDLADLQHAREVVGKLNETCPFCDGRGWNLRKRACAEDDRPDPDDPRDRVPCSACHSTGWKFWTDDEGVEHSAENYKQLPRVP